MASPRVQRSALVVEDSNSLRTLLASTLTIAGFKTTTCASANEALKSFGKADPDVLIADIDLGTRPNGVELATILRAQAPYLGIVFLTNYPSTKAFERTVSPPPNYAFMQKDLLTSTEQLIQVIESALDDAAKQKINLTGEYKNPLDKLTATQLEIVRLMAAGLTNMEIAERRGATLRAVERLVSRVFEILEINDDPQHNPRVVVTNMYTRNFGYPDSHEYLT
jgi:DNA-binding NarL/FixJ family response regulator